MITKFGGATMDEKDMLAWATRVANLNKTPNVPSAYMILLDHCDETYQTEIWGVGPPRPGERKYMIVTQCQPDNGTPTQFEPFEPTPRELEIVAALRRDGAHSVVYATYPRDN